MNLITEKRIGVLMGGLSAEREVSLKTGEAVLKALRSRGYNAVSIDAGRDVWVRLKAEGVEVAFIALHGRYGEDGAIQGMLEVMGIPYTGSGITASAVGMNKIFSKKIFGFHGLPVAQYYILNKKDLKGFAPNKMGFEFPVVVKPASEGSSVGVAIASEEKGLNDAFDIAFSYGDEIIIEKYIKGREIQVGILGDKALGAIEIIPNKAFYDYEAKYSPGMSRHVFPAPFPEAVYKNILELGLSAHRAIGCRGYSRVDMLIDSDNKAFLLEVNTLPGMTDVSLFPEIALGAGIDFSSLVEAILKDAIEKDINRA